MNQFNEGEVTRDGLIHRCAHILFCLAQPAIVEEKNKEEQVPEQAAMEEEPVAREEELAAELQQAIEKEPAEEHRDSESASQFQQAFEDPLKDICLEEMENQTHYTLQSLFFSRKLREEYDEYERARKSVAPGQESTHNYPQNQFLEGNQYNEVAMQQQTGGISGYYFDNQHNNF